MGAKSPYQVYAKIDPFWGERPPRGYGRTDRVDLNLFDAGHGDQIQARNPILLGLGVTLRLKLNAFVRTWQVFVKEAGGTEVEVTSQFKQVAPQMYQLQGTAGAGAFNPEDRDGDQWSDAVQLEFRVVTRNITLESTFYASMWIQNDYELRACADPCQDDFNMLRLLGRERVRLWRDYIEPTRQPRDTEVDTFVFLFDQAVALKNLSAELCACFSYYELLHVGIKFFIVGNCEEASFAEFPAAPGCNPFDADATPSQIPDDGAGNPLVLPMDWENSGC